MSSTEPALAARGRALRFAAGAFLLLCALGAWLWLRRHHPIAGACLAGAGAGLLATALAAPPAALAVRGAWMKLGEAIGWINSHLLLGLAFFLVITPLGLLRRALGHDPLRTRWRPGSEASYWSLRERGRDPSHYEHPY